MSTKQQELERISRELAGVANKTAELGRIIPPFVQERTRQVQLQQGEPPAVQRETSQTAGIAGGTAAQLTPYQIFNQRLMEMLQQAQQGIVPQIYGLQGQQLGLEEQRTRTGFRTPEELIGASPSLQAGVRSAEMEAFTPGIERAMQATTGLSSKLTQFENILKYAKEFGEEFAKVSPTPEILEGYKQMIRAGGNPSSIPDEVRNSVMSKMTKEDWDTWQKAGEKGITATQRETRAQSIAGQFRQEATVQRYNTSAEGLSNARTLVNSESNSANDIAMIYAFAKAMDPDSVVREGEYATVQKYAQSWAEAFGFKAARIFSNQPFLTSEAKKNLLNAMETKFKSIEPSYRNIYSEYARRIDNALQEIGAGRDYLTDYSAPYRINSQETNQTVTKGGRTFEVLPD